MGNSRHVGQHAAVIGVSGVRLTGLFATSQYVSSCESPNLEPKNRCAGPSRDMHEQRTEDGKGSNSKLFRLRPSDTRVIKHSWPVFIEKRNRDLSSMVYWLASRAIGNSVCVWLAATQTRTEKGGHTRTHEKSANG